MHTIRVKVTSGVRKESVCELPDGRYAVSVDADRKGGAANMRVRELLAEHFSVPLERIRITHGHTSPTKTIAIS